MRYSVCEIIILGSEKILTQSLDGDKKEFDLYLIQETFEASVTGHSKRFKNYRFFLAIKGA